MKHAESEEEVVAWAKWRHAHHLTREPFTLSQSLPAPIWHLRSVEASYRKGYLHAYTHAIAAFLHTSERLNTDLDLEVIHEIEEFVASKLEPWRSSIQADLESGNAFKRPPQIG